MEKEISPILVVNNKNLKPYIEIFQYAPENITQKQLGCLTGLFEIREYSEESAYIVNFLNSVLKKEYYLNSKRPVVESFDAALNKVNLALSELAKHGNIKWLGKLDSAICVLEKNNLHFAVTGKAKILLFRNNFLTEITADLAEESPEKLNPLETFINVSSGRLEKDDRLVITSDDIFQILSIKELKKNLARLEKEKFVQFLKTALTNELDLAGTVVVDISEPPKNEASATFGANKSQKKADDLNVFSQKAFVQNRQSENGDPNYREQTIEDAISKQEAAEYTDKKTGHIYIQSPDENKSGENKESRLNENWQIFQELTFNFFDNLKISLRKQFNWLRRKTKKFFQDVYSHDYKSHIEAAKNKLDSLKTKNDFSELEKKTKNTDFESYQQEKPGHPQSSEKINGIETPSIQSFNLQFKSDPITTKLTRFFQKISSFALPHLKKIANLFLKLSKKQKLYALIALALIIFLPMFFSRSDSEQKNSNSIENIETAPTATNPTSKYDQEKNMAFLEDSNFESIPTSIAAKKIFAPQDSLLAVNDKSVSIFDQNSKNWQTFDFPAESGKFQAATFMPDLNLVFTLTDQNQLISFSPLSKEIKTESIDIPSDSKIKFIATYLTYIYLLDAQNNQIYRFPRAEGGFGQKTDWLKDKIDLNSTQDLAVSENLLLAQKNKLLQLSQGRQTNLKFEDSQTLINFDQVIASEDEARIFILDRENSRLIEFNSSGQIVRQFQNEKIGQAQNLAFDEENKKIYLNLDKTILAFKPE